MKWEHQLIVITVLVLTALGGIAGMHTVRTTVIEARETEITAQRRAIAILEAQVEAMRPKPYCLPLDEIRISSGTRHRVPPLGGIDAGEKLHRGVDLAAPIGAPVHAVLAGKVTEHYPPPGGKWKGHPTMGGYIILDHGDELLTEYAHLSASFVNEGDWVRMGQVIGLVGSTGVSTGPHLHMAVIVSPLRYFAERR